VGGGGGGGGGELWGGGGGGGGCTSDILALREKRREVPARQSNCGLTKKVAHRKGLKSKRGRGSDDGTNLAPEGPKR